MKQAFLAVVLCILSITAKSQNIVNNSSCPVAITPVCYDPTACTYATCGAAVPVPAHSTVPLPTCVCTLLLGYQICWTTCTTAPCATIGLCGMSAYPCAAFGTSTSLSGCGTCVSVNIFCSTTGDIIVQ